MGARGPKAKPIERKALTGRTPTTTAGGRPLQPVITPYVRTAETPVPPLPEGVAGRGAVEWDKIWRHGYWLHENADYHWIEMVARAYQDIETFRKKIEEDGLIVKGYQGQPVANPLIAELRKAEANIMKALSILGFSPSDRARLGLAEAKAKSAIADLVKKTQENRG